MGQALGQLFPIAVASALSSVPITIMIIILLSPKRKQATIPYLAGWVLGTAAVLLLATLATQLLPDSRPRQPQTALGVLEILTGAALVLLGIWTLRRKPQIENSRMSTLMNAAGSFGA